MKPRATRDRILDAAERLFAEHGYDGASLRAITAQARVNLAAVNYHFRSKRALMRAVFARRLEPLNQKRLALLETCVAARANGPPDLERLVEALVAPPFRMGEQSRGEAAALRKLMGWVLVDPGVQIERVLEEQFHEVALHFVSAFRRALPGIPPEELFWRIHFSIGALASVLTGAPFLKIASGGRLDTSDVEGAVKRLVAYICGGLRAPLASGKRRRRGPPERSGAA
jgi:AcrR family transcriptional regulator